MKVFEGYPLRKILKREQALMWVLSPIVMQVVVTFLLTFYVIIVNRDVIQNFASETELMSALEPVINLGSSLGTVMGLVFLTIVIIWRKIPLVNRKQLTKDEWKVIPGLSKKDWRFLSWYIPVSYVIYILGNYILTSVFGEAEAINQQGIEELVGSTPILLMFLMVVIAAPIAEEWLFRGLILFRHNSLEASWLAVIVSSALFGLIHVPTDIPSAFSYIGMGFLFAYAAKQTRSVEAGIVYHMLNNLLGFIALYQ